MDTQITEVEVDEVAQKNAEAEAALMLLENQEKLGEMAKGVKLEVMPEFFRRAGLQMDSANFSIALSGEVSPEKVNDLIVKGLRWEAERGGLGEVYKELGGVVNAKSGKKQLPKGFKREEIEFSEENAGKFQKALVAGLAKFGEFKVSVGQYVAPDAPQGEKQARELYQKFAAAGKLTKLAVTTEWEGEEDDVEGFVKQIHAELFKK